VTWLVTGGAGYIGAHVVRAFQAEGIDVVVLDDLSSGHERFIPADVPFVRGTLLDGSVLERAFSEFELSGVVHVAGYKYAGVSVQRPLHTYAQNVTATAMLLGAMEEHGVERIVFSSSAAVYGTTDVDLVTEDTPKAPESPYGESKLIGEWLLSDQGVATGLRHTSLRYFNVVGSGTDEVYDTSPHNLFPLVFDALLAGRTPRINGDDYPTPDGTCVRDYLHVADLAAAHVAAAKLQPRERGRVERRGDHDRHGRGHGHRLHARDHAASRRRPRSDRRVGSARRSRSGLADASRPPADGGERVAGAPRRLLTSIGGTIVPVTQFR
jgi:UDP-glucose 4-epimerase